MIHQTRNKSILVVPPFLKYSAGPLLGPALLQSAAKARGHCCRLLDLNARYIQPRVSKRLGLMGSSSSRSLLVGDHDKPKGPQSLSYVEENFINHHILPSLAKALASTKKDDENRDLHRAIQYGFLTHSEVLNAAEELAQNTNDLGKWITSTFMDEDASDSPPDVVGVSLLHAGQVIPATTMTIIARRIWPQALVVWGGPHISGLGIKTLKQDIAERSFAADVFVVGHSERSIVQILDQVDALKQAAISINKPSIPKAMVGESMAIAPSFEELEWYDRPLTLPAQSTLGCAYGRCAFCTYPAIEDTPQKLDLFSSVGHVVDQARLMQSGTTISLKDSLATSTRLTEIGACIQGRVKWSACTKLSHRLDMKRLSQLCTDGLSTLEVGLESLLPQTQKYIDKIQPESLYEKFVHDVANLPDLSLVVNYMVGFPWEDSSESQAKLEDAKRILIAALGRERGHIELNEFELERMAAMAKFPEAYGINPTHIHKWPWASVMEIIKD